jgi:hypothetical protein
MNNLEQQVAEVKNPNQLDLFAGILFTEEQEQMIAEYKERCAKNALYYKNQNERLEQLLLGAGFIKDVNFVNNFQIKNETRKVTLGSTWKNNCFETDFILLGRGVTFKFIISL